MGDNRYERSGRSSVRGGGADRRRASYPQPYRRAQQGGQSVRGGRRLMPAWFLAITDLLIMGVLLNVFALGNSGLLRSDNSGDQPQSTVAVTQQPTPSPTLAPTQSANGTPAPSGQPTATPVANQGMWGAKFPGKFTDGGAPVITSTTYQSKDINIAITIKPGNGYNWYIAEIFICNKDNFQAFFKNGKFQWYAIDSTQNQANARNAILAINGDNSANRPNKAGYELRNGGQMELSVPWEDVLVMYNDGSMETFDKAGFEKENSAINNGSTGNGGVWQVWTFGPMLLDANGQPMTQFAPDSITGSANERTAIGYCEPGHYFFVAAGSADSSSRAGPSLTDLSQEMYSLGCKVAYNMDGGQSSEMVFNGQVVNTPYKGGRGISDIVGIFEDN